MLRLDRLSEDYIAELGDSFDPKEEGSPEGLPVEGFVLPAEGPGVYRLTYRVKVKEDVGALWLFAGRKNLLRFGSRKAGEILEGECFLHICEVVPRQYDRAMAVSQIGFAAACEDASKLEISASSQRLEPDADVPVVYIGGDSTVTSQVCGLPYLPGGCYCGWGQSLSYFLAGSAAVQNQAQSGLTTETFREGGYYDIVLKYIRPGDYCLLQFGHNDQKLAHLQAKTGYRENLLRFIGEIRGKGAKPVLVTPLARNTWTAGGVYNDLLEEHAQEVIRVGEETGTPVIDLHGFAMDLIQTNGKENSRVYFHPGDMTHPNEYGGFFFASFIAERLQQIYPAAFSVKRPDGDLLPDPDTAFLTGVAAQPGKGGTQREIFDTMERAGDSLVERIEAAKKEAQQL